MKLFSLYLHVPFCLSKCGYCSFYSRPVDHVSVRAWLDGVARETEYLRQIWGGKLPLRTLYIGGGTPGVLSLDIWRRLLRLIENRFDLSALVEATVESNPCSLTEEHLALWRGAFFTRLSLGVQSFQNNELLWLGRRHDAATAAEAIEKSLRHNFDVSIDLIFGHPAQTLRSWHDTLRQAVASGAGHISTYQLTLEPETPLGAQNPALPDGYSFYRFAQWFLSRKGFVQYEIASFAQTGKECRHNLSYWSQENVLALGPSASGYLADDGFRYLNASTLEEYLHLSETGLPITQVDRLDKDSRGTEAAILALRTKWGVDMKSFVERFGRKLWDNIASTLRALPERLVSADNQRIRLTPSGMRIGNAIWTELLALSDKKLID